ncbi:MAG: SEC-C metal-binding domain-containing protein [Caldilineaceae bacterium]|nr:SEC-C metal-binding domain-containing protein [Caldilineaceae bacterium]MDE0338637.1 SEC-C metal-binding domain-containing protein [Caldilineaceae bacterium]
MRLAKSDIEWLKFSFPNLRYDAEAQRIMGELDFCAAFNRDSGKMEYGCDPAIRALGTHLCDVFEIEIHLDSDSIEDNGWPIVHETGGKFSEIAAENNVEPIDLHFFENGACCLGIGYARERNLTLERFLYHLVIPFFYRLSYTDQYGIKAAQTDLWGELSHGDRGHREHVEEMLRYAKRGLGRNDPCPCGSGVKFKKCCQDEVNEVMRRLRPPIQNKSG